MAKACPVARLFFVENILRSSAPRIPAFAAASGRDDHGWWMDLQLPVAAVAQRLRWIRPGKFLMGSPAHEPERDGKEGPQHPVTLTRGFWLADTACTQALWEAVMGQNPSRFDDDVQRPVEQVSWDDVHVFLRTLETLMPGVTASLPTEAQWEYACRAGTETPFSFGVQINLQQVNCDGFSAHGNDNRSDSRGTTVRVKSLPPNAWGLYEMHGNVWEWCEDRPRAYGGQAQHDPAGAPPGAGAMRAVRGGSWCDDARFARSASRGECHPEEWGGDGGFRFCVGDV
jgi:formylglycine-generating enzyme required for sulfatase activity